MLLGIACCAALLLLRGVLQYAEAKHGHVAPGPTAEEEFDNRRAALGAAFLILYVAAMPFIGFAIATIVFFLFWLPSGGVRRPLPVAGVAVIGTVVLLFTFVKLTTLPLERGIGVFDGLTVSLYRLLGIY
jgi:putative tricarboxylic transport membrane protein